MSKKMIWRLGVFMLLICTTFVYMTVRNLAEIRQLKQKTDAIQKPTEDRNKQKPVVKTDEQPPAEQGFKWVWHKDHWDKVPIDTPDVSQGKPHEPIVQPGQMAERPKYTGELTYEAYEKYVIEAFQNIERNEFGLPLSPFPAVPPSFIQNPEEKDKANRLWNKLSAEYDKSIDAAMIRMDARFNAPEYTGELTIEAYRNYLAERKKLKEANNE